MQEERKMQPADHRAVAVRLVRPSIQDEEAIWAYRDELRRSGSRFDGSAGLGVTQSYTAWLDPDRRMRTLLGDDAAKTELFLALDAADGAIVGIITYRHPLTPSLLHSGGNIGYNVRPSRRCQGYATNMLAAMLDLCRAAGETRILVTCDRDNDPSRRTILRNGGVLENEVEDTLHVGYSGWIQRYWIRL